MPGEYGFPLNHLSIGMWIPFKIGKYPDSQMMRPDLVSRVPKWIQTFT